ncbi:MAG: hypothetical protein AAFQ98_02645, partial [Bacteroidota bacterium]
GLGKSPYLRAGKNERMVDLSTQTRGRYRAHLGALVLGLLGLGSCEFEEYNYAFPQPSIIEVREVDQEEFTIEWGEVFDAEEYLLEVSTDSAFSTEVGVVTFISDRTDQKVRGNRIAPFEMYYCRVSTATEGVSDENYSEVVTVQLLPLEPPILGVPDELPPGIRLVRWESIPLAEKYQVQISLALDFEDSTQVFVDDETEEMGYGWAPESFFDEYYFRARSVNGENVSEWSDTIFIGTNSEATCVLQEILTDSTDYRFKIGGQNGESFIEEMQLFTQEGMGGREINRQSAFFEYTGDFLAYATVEDFFLGSFFWEFFYDIEGRLEYFALYDTIDQVLEGMYFYNEEGQLDLVGIVNYHDGVPDTSYISFLYNEQGDVVQQIGPGETELTFTYTEDVVNPNFWLPVGIQLMVQQSPELSLLGIDYSWRSFLSVLPKNKAIASITDQDGRMVTFENFSESGQLNAAQSEDGLIDYEFGRCGF